MLSLERQKGIILLIALMALVIISLAAISLVRSVDTGSLVAGNVTFKQTATAASDRATENAISWLQANNTGNVLFADNTAQGFYSTALYNLDLTNKKSTTSRALVDWDSNDCGYAANGSYSACIDPAAAVTINGYTARYIISRQCETAGDPNLVSNNCARALSSTGESPKRGELKYGEDKRFASNSGPYYRILVRTEGPRETVSYTETLVYF